MAFTENEIFNLVSGAQVTGESPYDLWKSLGNEGTAQDFLNYLKDDGESNVSEETLAQIEKNKNDISQLTEQISDLNSTLSNLTITKIMRFNLYLELSSTTNSYALFTLSKLNELFGVSGATAPCFTILVNNADGEAFGSHIDSCVWLNGNTFYITWNEVLSVNKNARVYVTVFYTPLANVIKSI